MVRHAPAARFAAVLLLATGLCAGLDGCASSTVDVLSGQPSLATAQVALAGGNNDVALRICDTLIVKDPHNAELLMCRGDALSRMQRPGDATTAYETALRADPRATGALIGLGRLTLGADPARAEALFVRALALDPRNAVALNNLGIARDMQGRHADAQAAYGQAIAAAPEMRAAQVNLALSMAMSGKTREAVEMMRPIGTRADASARERHDLAAVLAMDGKQEEAEQLLRSDLNGEQTDAAINGYKALQAR